jgi:hypothetical protein
LDVQNPLSDLLQGLNPLPSLSGGATAPAKATPDTATGPGWLTSTLAQYVTIGLGLILIIAGLFQFKAVQQGTGFAAKAAVAAA